MPRLLSMFAMTLTPTALSKRPALALLLLAALPLLAACGDEGGSAAPLGPDPTDDGPVTCEPVETTPAGELLRPSPTPTEFVEISVERAIDRDTFLALTEPLFGADAAAGNGHDAFALYPGLLVTSRLDERTADQVVAEVALADPEAPGDEPGVVARLPMSLARGVLFIESVVRAIESAEAATAEDPERTRPWRIAYHARSALGGSLTLTARWDTDAATARLGIVVRRTETSLLADRVNEPAYDGDPYEQVTLELQLSLSYPELSYFARQLYLARASGGGSSSGREIAAPGYEWFRLHYESTDESGIFEVVFEVETRDGRTIALASAPGTQSVAFAFLQGVDRLWAFSRSDDAAEIGATGDFRIAFDYRDPDASGTAVATAMVEDGRFALAYEVVTPTSFLHDIDVVPYPAAPQADPDPTGGRIDCAALGSEEAARGKMMVQFSASDVLRRTEGLEFPLSGTLHVGIYRKDDVTLLGPRDDAVAVETIDLAGFVLPEDGLSDVVPSQSAIFAGEYHVIGFLDLNDNADPEALFPDPGEPVIIPTTPHPLRCAEQPIEVEFAIPYPDL